MKPTILGKTTIKILVMWVVIFVAAWALMEALFFCCVASLFPYSARVGMGFGVYPLLQTSKHTVAPQSYIGIFGDSYAFGAGEWFIKVQQERAPTFNTAHLLYQQTGRDVISFGIPGSSNLSGWIEDPVSAIQYINEGGRYKLPNPDEIILFFYEGNDIQEGFTDLQARYIANGYDIKKMGEPDYFDEFIQKEMLDKNKYIMLRREQAPLENLYFFRFATQQLSNYKEHQATQQLIKQLLENPPKNDIQQANIDGIPVFLPNDLGAPPVEMGSEERKQTLAFINSIAGFVRRHFDKSKMLMIYIPSPASSYEIITSKVHVYGTPLEMRFDQKEILAMSDQLCQTLEKIAAQHDMSFIDARPAIFQAGKKQMLHGLFDTGHFNEQGYRALSDVVSRALLVPEAHQGKCAAR